MLTALLRHPRPLLALLLAFAVPAALTAPAGASGYPCDPPNILPRAVCGMDSFHGSPPRQIPNGWNDFVLNGDLTYMRDEDSTSPPSLRMWSDGGTFRAGIYTQAQVAPGAGYRASIEWAAPDPSYADTFGRQLGIDPTGGTDPRASTVIWGPIHWGAGRIMNYPIGIGPNIDVAARAQAGVMTIFFLVDHPHSTGSNLIFIDTIALFPDEASTSLATYLPALLRAAPGMAQASASPGLTHQAGARTP